MLRNLLHALWPHTLLSVVLLAAGAALAVALTTYATRRTLTRPVAFALEDEVTVLAAVLGDLRRYPYLTAISPNDFAAGTHHRIWAALRHALGDDAEMPEGATEDDCARKGQALVAHGDAIRAAMLEQLAGGPAPEVDAATIARMVGIATTRNLIAGVAPGVRDRADAATITAAEHVLSAGQDRNRLAGAALIVPSKTPDSVDRKQPPLQRVLTPASRTRFVVTAALTALAASLAPGVLVAAGFSGTAAVLAVGSLLPLLAMSVIISLVDIDTLYIDTPVWAAGTFTSWAFAIAATLALGEPSRLLAGVVGVVGTVVLFEGANLIFKLVRGQDGQGFGDTLIIIATVGAPAALTGSFSVAWWSVMAGMVAGIAGWVVGFATGRLTRHSPYAFGPWLAAGWVGALVVHCLNANWLT